MLNQTEKYGVNVTATNREFLGMFKVFAETKDAKNVKFAVINVVNSKVLQDHLAYLEQMATPTQEFVELSIKAKGSGSKISGLTPFNCVAPPLIL